MMINTCRCLSVAFAPATAITAGPSGPSIQSLSVQHMSGALGIGIGIVQTVHIAWAARFTEVISVDLPKSIAANVVVHISSPRGLIPGDADHVGVVGSREVLVREGSHLSAIEIGGDDVGGGLPVAYLGSDGGGSWFALHIVTYNLGHIEDIGGLNLLVEAPEVVYFALSLDVSSFHADRNRTGGGVIEGEDGGVCSKLPVIALLSLSGALSFELELREVWNGQFGVQFGVGASLLLCSLDQITLSLIVAIDLDAVSLCVSFSEIKSVAV